jgi:hypothetical protein
MVVIEMREIWRIIGYGSLTWLIPFIIALPFYSPGGTILIDSSLFKSIMIIAGASAGAVLIIRLYLKINDQYVLYGFVTGLIWLIINWILDLVILVPMNGLDYSSYFYQIGLRYLMIPVMTVMAGFVAQNAVEHAHKS